MKRPIDDLSKEQKTGYDLLEYFINKELDKNLGFEEQLNEITAFMDMNPALDGRTILALINNNTILQRILEKTLEPVYHTKYKSTNNSTNNSTSNSTSKNTPKLFVVYCFLKNKPLDDDSDEIKFRKMPMSIESKPDKPKSRKMIRFTRIGPYRTKISYDPIN